MGGAGVGCGLRGVGWSKRGLSDRVSALVCSCWGLCRLKGVPYSKCNPAKHNICRCHRDVRAAAAHPEPGWALRGRVLWKSNCFVETNAAENRKYTTNTLESCPIYSHPPLASSPSSIRTLDLRI